MEIVLGGLKRPVYREGEGVEVEVAEKQAAEEEAMDLLDKQKMRLDQEVLEDLVYHPVLAGSQYYTEQAEQAGQILPYLVVYQEHPIQEMAAVV